MVRCPQIAGILLFVGCRIGPPPLDKVALTVEIRAVDQDQRPVSGVRLMVTLWSDSDRLEEFQDVTDADGRASRALRYREVHPELINRVEINLFHDRWYAKSLVLATRGLSWREDLDSLPYVLRFDRGILANFLGGDPWPVKARVVLARKGVVQVRCVDAETGVSIEGAKLWVVEVWKHGRANWHTGRTEEGGKFLWSFVDAPDAIVVSARDGEHVVCGGKVEPAITGRTVELTVRMKRGAVVAGRVSCRSGACTLKMLRRAPYPEELVVERHAPLKPMYYGMPEEEVAVRTDDEGRFSARLDPTAAYGVIAECAGRRYPEMPFQVELVLPR